MDFIYNWKFWLFLITILGIIVNLLASFKIATNDLVHIGADLKDVKKEVSRVKSKVYSIDKKLAVQEQKVEDLEKSIS